MEGGVIVGGLDGDLITWQEWKVPKQSSTENLNSCGKTKVDRP
jgi:hypothetical protein